MYFKNSIDLFSAELASAWELSFNSFKAISKTLKRCFLNRCTRITMYLVSTLPLFITPSLIDSYLVLLYYSNTLFSKRVHMSNYNFHRTFSFIVGMTTNEYIRKRRLTLAARELQTTNISVMDAAYKYG